MTGERAGFELTGTYVHLTNDGAAAEVTCTPAFWQELASGARRFDGRLMGAVRMAESMSHWEMHPAGDELLHLVAGAADVILERGGRESAVTLRAGRTCVVPRGVWHRLVVHEPGELIFITAGEGTQHRPYAPARASAR